MDHRSGPGLWPLLHYRYWAITGTPLGISCYILCPGDPLALELQVLPLHVLQRIIEGVDVVAGQLITLGSGPGWLRIGQPTSFL